MAPATQAGTRTECCCGRVADFDAAQTGRVSIAALGGCNRCDRFPGVRITFLHRITEKTDVVSARAASIRDRHDAFGVITTAFFFAARRFFAPALAIATVFFTAYAVGPVPVFRSCAAGAVVHGVGARSVWPWRVAPLVFAGLGSPGRWPWGCSLASRCIMPQFMRAWRLLFLCGGGPSCGHGGMGCRGWIDRALPPTGAGPCWLSSARALVRGAEAGGERGWIVDASRDRRRFQRSTMRLRSTSASSFGP